MKIKFPWSRAILQWLILRQLFSFYSVVLGFCSTAKSSIWTSLPFRSPHGLEFPALHSRYSLLILVTHCMHCINSVYTSVTSLLVHWLRLCFPVQGVWAGSPISELRSHMPQLKKKIKT